MGSALDERDEQRADEFEGAQVALQAVLAKQWPGRAALVTEQGRAEYEDEIAALRADLGNTAFEEAWAAGRELTFEAALALARED